MGQRYSELVKARRLGSAFIGPDNTIVDPGQTTRSFSPSMANFPTEFNEKKSVKSKPGPKRIKEDDGYPCTKCNSSYSRLYKTINHLKKGKRKPQKPSKISNVPDGLMCKMCLTVNSSENIENLGIPGDILQNSEKRVSILNDTILNKTSKAMKRTRDDILNDPIPPVSTPKSPFKVPKEKVKTNIEKSEAENDDQDDEISIISTASSTKNLYTRSEEKNIIQWIIENKRHSEIKGIKMWRELEKSNEVPGRSCQSMKERFRKHILPKIQHYQLKKDQVVLFTAHR